MDVQSTKFYYSCGVVGVLVGFSIMLWISIVELKEYVGKNLEMINFLSIGEIRIITENLAEFLKVFLSSQL